MANRGLLFDEPMTGLRTGSTGGVYISARGVNVFASPAIGEDLGIEAGSGGITIDTTDQLTDIRATLSATGGGAISIRSASNSILMSTDALLRTEGGPSR